MDYNRNERCAFEQSSQKAKTNYQDYHNAIKQKIEDMLPENGSNKAFLFDIHGTDDEKDPNGNFVEIIIGTDHGRSRKALTYNQYWAQNNLYNLLEDKNIRAYRTKLEEEKDETHTSLDGGTL